MTQFALAAALGLLFAVGTFLVLRRDVVRVVWGVVIVSQSANVYLVTMGGLSGSVPVLEHHGGEHGLVTDPLVQALVLTAIVIGFGTTAFALVLTYRVYEEHGTIDLRDLARGTEGTGAASEAESEAESEPETDTEAGQIGGDTDIGPSGGETGG